MSLLRLPIELQQRIISETIPESIENVAVTCRALYDASERYVEQHNSLRKRFRHFSFSTFNTSSGTWDNITAKTGIFVRHGIDLLMSIIHNPRIARYIETADLKAGFGRDNLMWDDNHVSHQPENTRRSPRLTKGEDIKALQQFLRESPYLKQIGEHPDFWEDMILEETYGHAEILLLSLLTNVRELALPTGWPKVGLRGQDLSGTGTDFAAWRVLDQIVYCANDPGFKGAGLSKLEILRPFAGSGYNCRNSMTLNTPFLALESLREAYIGGCVALEDGYTGLMFSPEYSSYSPRLEKLELVGCTFEAWEMRVLLSRMPNLKYFRFAYEAKWDACGMNYDSGEILNTIMECTGETLEQLSVWLMTKWGSMGSTLTDMRGFKRLRSLEIDGAMLMGPEFRKDHIEESKGDFNDAPLTSPIDEMAAPRLVDLLPPSLESLRILAEEEDDDDDERSPAQLAKCFRALFDGLSQRRQDRLPRLREIVLEVLEDDLDINLLKEIEAKGATVLLQEATQLQPDFVHDFYDRFGVSAEREDAEEEEDDENDDEWEESEDEDSNGEFGDSEEDDSE